MYDYYFGLWYIYMVNGEPGKKLPFPSFKAKCLALLERVRRTKKPIRITRFGNPVAEGVPPSPDTEPGE
jgi:hypothetical protein